MKSFKTFLNEGGNIGSAAPFSVQSHTRAARRTDVHTALSKIHDAFNKEHGEHLFGANKEHLKTGHVYSGSSHDFMGSHVSDQEFAQHKPHVGDVDVQVSLGDFVLSGGEIAAIALLDAVARLQPGVLNDEGSHQMDSFNPALDGLLDCGHYTRPEMWSDLPVPAVLMSGHHADIAKWRRQQSLALTQKFRPDLILAARQASKLSVKDENFLATLGASNQASA